HLTPATIFVVLPSLDPPEGTVHEFPPCDLGPPCGHSVPRAGRSHTGRQTLTCQGARALGVSAGETCPAARGKRCSVAAHPHRRLCAGTAGSKASQARAGCRPANAPAPRLSRYHRPAAHPRRTTGLYPRHFAKRLRKGSGRLAVPAAVRRTLGKALARRRSL